MFEADLAACRAMLRGGSRSFFAAALLLPRRVHRPATALYAFCRVADDLIDSGAISPTKPSPAGGRGLGEGGQRVGGSGPADHPHPGPLPPAGEGDALAMLQRRLDLVYAGRPAPEPADRALAHVVAEHRIPRILLDRLLEGFAWDAEGRRYEDLPALHAYAARVAGTVGAVMAVLMGAREAATLARACDLGVAMQLTNIARDVGEDARAGRIYLPLSWMREEGLDPDTWLTQPEPGPALARVIARLLEEASRLYARADWGIAALPLACRPGIGTARRLYAAIGAEVARNQYDSVTRRARVALPRKLGLAARSLLAAPVPARREIAPPLAATQELVTAAALPPRPRPPWLEDRVVWLLDLFAALHERQARGG